MSPSAKALQEKNTFRARLDLFTFKILQSMEPKAFPKVVNLGSCLSVEKAAIYVT